MAKITGTARPTKDGLYVDDCVLLSEEIEKFDKDMDPEDFENLEIEVIGDIVEKTSEAEPKIIEQKREGTTKYLCNISSIKKIRNTCSNN